MRSLLGMLIMAGVSFATPITYTTFLSGLNESPVNSSTGTGTATVTYDSALHTLAVTITFADLLSNTTNSHIHCCTSVSLTGTAGVATMLPSFLGFPSGVTSGSYSATFDLTLASSWNPSFVTNNGGTTAAAEAVLASGLASGKAYLNIHTTQFAGGEIRGFLATPEPATLGLTAFAIAGLLLKRRKAASAR